MMEVRKVLNTDSENREAQWTEKQKAGSAE